MMSADRDRSAIGASQEREEWQALVDADTLHMLPPQALIASVKHLAARLLTLTADQSPNGSSGAPS